MRRYSFYLIIASLTFACGSLVVFNLYRVKPQENALNFEQPKSSNISEVKPSSPKKKFVCEDEAAKFVWDKLKKEKDLIEWAIYIAEESGAENCRQVFDMKNIDLNGDKSDEVFIRGSGTLCGSGADCRTWILSKINGKYRVILEMYAAEFDDPEILRTKTNDYRDLKVKKNNHRVADTYGFFKFDGKKYRATKCFEDIYSDEYRTRGFEEYMKADKLNLIRVKPNHCR